VLIPLRQKLPKTSYCGQAARNRRFSCRKGAKTRDFEVDFVSIVNEGVTAPAAAWDALRAVSFPALKRRANVRRRFATNER
jgi:hypothetical protein